MLPATGGTPDGNDLSGGSDGGDGGTIAIAAGVGLGALLAWQLLKNSDKLNLNIDALDPKLQLWTDGGQYNRLKRFKSDSFHSLMTDNQQGVQDFITFGSELSFADRFAIGSQVSLSQSSLGARTNEMSNIDDMLESNYSASLYSQVKLSMGQSLLGKYSTKQERLQSLPRTFIDQSNTDLFYTQSLNATEETLGLVGDYEFSGLRASTLFSLTHSDENLVALGRSDRRSNKLEKTAMFSLSSPDIELSETLFLKPYAVISAHAFTRKSEFDWFDTQDLGEYGRVGLGFDWVKGQTWSGGLKVQTTFGRWIDPLSLNLKNGHEPQATFNISGKF